MDAAPPSLDVVAVGSAIVDVLAHSSDAFIASHGLVKGTMVLVDHDQSATLYDAMPAGIEISGGSAANTAAGIASLGGDVAFIGKVRDDALGEIFTHDLRSTGVVYTTPPGASGPPTARCLVLITPDAERTMGTYLGTAGEMSAADVDPALVASARITYVEGYLVGLPTAEGALEAALKAAHTAGRKVALTLSDPAWVALQHDAFKALLPEIDILLGNQAEALELTGEGSLDGALRALAKTCPVVAITRGASGAVAADRDEIVSVPSEPVDELEDTTGAGDLFASGFLLGSARERPLEECLRLGALAAAEVISHIGARPQISLASLAASKGLDLFGGHPRTPGS
jgi:sugar/nucleoside kinase (ribokinase family)